MAHAPSTRLNLIALGEGKIRTLHITWFAFFLTFFLWFSHAPLLIFMRESMLLTTEQVKALLILNVALTIPARIVIGMLVDRFGPRITYGSLLITSSVICFAFALAQTFEQLAIMRFLMGFVGAGFVIGIRMISEWFPARQVGIAQGIYGGWGNFGSAAAAMSLPTIALLFGGDDGWRLAIMAAALVAGLYGLFYLLVARDTPEGSTYFKPNRTGGLEVTSRGDFVLYLAMNIPMYAALAVLAWKLSPAGVGLYSATVAWGLYASLVALFFVQLSQIYRVNRENLRTPVPAMQRYSFRQVAILDLAYLVTFGSELAVVSMLPLYYSDVFSLSPVQAGLIASGFAFMNLVARPAGGWFSDRFGRRKTLMIMVFGLTCGYLLMSQITGSWPLLLALLATMCCSFFVQSGEGAVFAMVPLIQRRLTGQIAGMVGAYGNVGAVIFLTALSFMDASSFFLVIAGSSAVTLVALTFLREPEGQMTEVLPDGSVQFINVT